MDKILKIQSEIGVLSKTETNPFFKSKYMDINGLLAQLLPLLEKYGLTVVQPLTNIDGRPAIRTVVYENSNLNGDVIVHKKDEVVTVNNFGNKEIVNDVVTLPDLQDPQKMGSAITYYRRYSLQSLFLLQAQDDDGEGAKPAKKETTKEYQARMKALKDNGGDPTEDEL